MPTRREVLIAHGIPAEQLAHIEQEYPRATRLDEVVPSDMTPAKVLITSFGWSSTPQGLRYWNWWHGFLREEDEGETDEHEH